MAKYVALLRGINVGGNNRVPMAELRVVCESLGYQDVQTYINSGNVLFVSATKPEGATLERAIEKQFGFPVPTLVRPLSDLKKINDAVPSTWANNTEQKTDVLFLWDAVASKKTCTELLHNPAVDTKEYVAKSIVWHLKKKDYNKSKLHDIIGTKLYKQMTVRNINTVRKLIALAERE